MSIHFLLRRKAVFLVLLILCAINFFEFQSIKGSSFRFVQFGYLIVATALAFPFLFPARRAFVLPVQLIFFSVFISMFTSTIARDQNLSDSLIGTVPVLIWGIFFYLKYLGYPVLKIERIVIGFGLVYLVLYFFQFANPNLNYFIDPELIDYSRGIARIVFPGRGIFYLSIFIAITRVTTGASRRWFWVSLSALGIIVTVMQVTRQFIFATLVIYLIHFLRSVRWIYKIMVAAVAIGLALYISQSDSPIVAALKETQEQNAELGADYVRIQSGSFFMKDLSNNNFQRVFGNGVPYGTTSPYLKEIGGYIKNNGYWLSDVGLIAVYAMFGIFAVLGYVLLWIKSFTLPVPKQFYYVKYYLWFLLLTCLTSDTIYSSYDLISTVLVVYIYQSFYEDEVPPDKAAVTAEEGLPVPEQSFQSKSSNEPVK